MSKLRPYQERDFNNICESWKNSNSVLYQLPTGGGKSVVIEHLVLKYQKEKILILAHKRELVFQMKKRLEANGLKVGIIIGNIEENVDSNIVVASIRTVTREKRTGTILEKEFDKIIIDEAHHIRTSGYENVLDQYIKQHPQLKILGVTATPYRKDKKPLNKYFDNLICSDSVSSLQEQGYLAKYKVYFTPTPNIKDEVEDSGNDYQIQSLGNYMMKPQMLQFLVDSYKKYGNNNQMIVFCVDKKHSKAVKQIYLANGYDSIAHIDSDTDLSLRAEILDKFANNKLQIITCIETLTEGVDLPETKCIQLARPTKSLILYLQMVGRGSRPKQDNSECILLDNAGCSVEHKLPNSPREWSLNPLVNPNNPNKKHKILGKRKDGSYTEDESEMPFLELVEMTDEEYALNIEGGIEKSEQYNKECDEKCRQLLKEIGEFVIEKSKESNLKLESNQFTNNYVSDDEVNFKFYNTLDIELQFYSDCNGFLVLPKNSWYNNINKKELKLKQLEKILVGELTKELSKEKNEKFIVDRFNKVKEIKDLKINIGELESKKREFEEKQNKLKLEHHLIKNNDIIIEGYINLGNYFRNSYWREHAVRLRFSKNKLLSTNNIEFTLDDGKKVHRENVKPEKVLEMLKGKKWK